MKYVLMSGLALLVPVLGLFSCSKDKPDTDSWSIAQPTIEGTGLTAMSFSSAYNRTLPGDAEIHFQDGTIWKVLNATSTCHSGDAITKQDLAIPTTLRLPLKALWPRALWYSLTEPQMREVECSLEFQAQNDQGSTHSFSLQNIKLGWFNDRSQNAVHVTAVSNEILKAMNVTTDADVSLVCKAQRAHLTAQEYTLDSSPLNSLIRQLNLHGQQTCHVVIDRALAVPEYKISDEFSLQFPNVALNVSIQRAASVAAGVSIGNALLYSVLVSNPSLDPAFVRVTSPGNSGDYVWIRDLTNAGGSGQTVRARSGMAGIGVVMAVGGATPVAPEVYRIDPGATLNAQVSFAAGTAGSGSYARVPDRTALGFGYILDFNTTVEQLPTAESSESSVLQTVTSRKWDFVRFDGALPDYENVDVQSLPTM